MEFKDRLRATREQCGMSQNDLAEAMGLTRPSISAWESGRSKPRLDKLNELAALFGVSPHWLLDGSDTSDTSGLSALEWELIMCFRSTDERGRETIMSVARSQRGATGAPPSRVRSA